MILQTFLVTNQAAPGFFQLWDGGPDGTHGPQTGSPSTEPDFNWKQHLVYFTVTRVIVTSPMPM